MAISTMSEDIIQTSTTSDMLTGLYYYMIPRPFSYEYINFIPYHNGAIQSISFNPFISKSDFEGSTLNCGVIPFDKERYSVPETMTSNSYVYRIASLGFITKTLYNAKQSYNSDEPILNTFPYHYCLVTDGFNTPLLIKTENLPDLNLKLCVETCCNQGSKYKIYVDGYKGDYGGYTEGLINNNPMLCSVSSDMYSQFYATCGASYATQNEITLKQNDLQLAKTLTSTGLEALGGGLSLDLDSAGRALANAMFATEEHNLTEYNVEKSKLSKDIDLKNTPRGVTSLGNDLNFSLKVIAKEGLRLVRYGMKDGQYNKIKRFYKRYGYPVNDYLVPDLKSRKYWNFIKTTNCDIYGNIPLIYLEEMKQIFNQGTTFWHIDNGATIKNYDLDNVEV